MSQDKIAVAIRVIKETLAFNGVKDAVAVAALGLVMSEIGERVEREEMAKFNARIEDMARQMFPD